MEVCMMKPEVKKKPKSVRTFTVNTEQTQACTTPTHHPYGAVNVYTACSADVLSVEVNWEYLHKLVSVQAAFYTEQVFL